MCHRALAAYQVRRLINRTSVPMGWKVSPDGTQGPIVESVREAMVSYFAKTG